MSTRTESDVRSQFNGLLCGDCGGDVTRHLLHGATYHRFDKCPWTWIGVVRRALESGKAQVTIPKETTK